MRTVSNSPVRVASALASELPNKPALVRTARGAESPVSFAQQRLWFLHQLEPDSPAYNAAVTVRIAGALDIDAVTRSFSEIVRRHEVLRTVFVEHDGVPAQVVQPAAPIALPRVDLTARTEKRQLHRDTLERFSKCCSHWPVAGPNVFILKSY